MALGFATLNDNVTQGPGYLLPLNSDQPSTLSPEHDRTEPEEAKTSSFPSTSNATDIELWNDPLPSGISDDAGVPIFETSDLVSHAPAGVAAAGDTLVFEDIPDADFLEQYLNYTDVFDPSLTELLDLDFLPEPSSNPRESEVIHDEAYVFKSPLTWVADWSVENLRGDPRYAEVVEQRVFNLPRTSEILTLLRLYFSHAHHRLPVLNEHYFYVLTDQRNKHGAGRTLERISLALLYAIMFSACTYLRTETTEASLLRAIRSMRNYPGHFVENERWIIKAYRTLQEAGAMPSNNSDRGFVDQPEWKRACACWFHRFTSSQLGLKWTNSPDLMETSRLPWHQISLADFQEDFSFSWHLNADIKKQLIQIFVKRIDLNTRFCHLNKFLWKRTASEMHAAGEASAFTQIHSSETLPIEQIEVLLQEWKLAHTFLLSMEAAATATPFEKRLLRAEQTLVKLAYDLYQNTLIIDRPLITEWAASMIRSSRAAMWKSIDSIRQTFKNALDEKLILLLPVNMLLVVFLPLTIYSIYMRKVQVFDASAIENLATCSQVARTMIDLHDGADFYGTILSNTLALADKHKATSTSGDFQVVKADTSSTHATVPAESSAERILPDPQLHSLVLRFHNLALALGRMPKIEAIVPKLSTHRKFAPDVS
ncbi:hypothetical protein H2200_001775 [Cladophialophora chaetospira]|uniref:Transcription factor domain-containing protein n=1 Tax=Cladophialophora chaetospira TaxID=386627 RepID=A0AA39CPE3_9EURO|nr:hypothetical protein H2200_001775 [Cladophialophora chaetospira]